MKTIQQISISLFLSLLLFSHCVYAKNNALHLFIFPYLSPGKIIKHNKELKDYLSAELKHPISIISARSFLKYLEGVKTNKHDLILAAPHIARYAQLNQKYKPIAITTQYVQGYFLVKKNSPMKTLADAKGKTISMAPPLAIIQQTAVESLQKVGITLHKNITQRAAKGHQDALHLLLQGKSDIALFGVNIWKKLSVENKKVLRILTKTKKSPGLILLGHKDLTPHFLKHIKKSILAFKVPKDNSAFLFSGFKAVSKETMRQLDPYTKPLQ